ncbi:complement resistance protein TraT [Photobacterium phosphoreum]|uniref:complement resistance protein TraT n=1 Tax=Photobacterium phosphoreum TaxID=659 RepID=UPI000D16C75E|nr:complement resistance protein TraT [Photobacterium phosphoreum]PSW26223.1 complement resistance protein TraT [Photobacterium phosphoreum]
MKNYKILISTVLLTLMMTISGCSAVSTAIKKRNLEVQTKMSDTVFLEPVNANQQVIYLQIRNTSDEQNIKVAPQIEQQLESKGYNITKDLAKAHYLIQANILKVGKSDLRDNQSLLGSGFGSGVTGAIVGASAFGGGSGMIGTGLIGGLVGVATDAMVEDTNYVMVTDVQISERAKNGVVVTEHNQATLHQGTSGSKTIISDHNTDWNRYQTRIVSTANQVNLEFPKAEPELEKGLAGAIAGIF